jgi:tetratricopeptide (TPR) repeat protein
MTHDEPGLARPSALSSSSSPSLGEWHGPPPAWHGDRPRIVVVPFAAYDYDGYQAIYARRLAEWLAVRLHATGAVDAAFPLLTGLNRGQPDYAMLTRLPEPAQVRALCAPAGARWALFGRLNLRDTLEWEIILLDVMSGDLVFGDQHESDGERPLEAITVLALHVLRAIGVPALDDDARSRLFAGNTRSPEALRAYLLAADLLGHPARVEQDATSAIGYAVEALRHDPTFYPAADLMIAEALRRLEGDAAEAEAGLALLRHVAAVAPNYHKAPATIGMLWQRGNNHAEAVRAYREALRLSPDHPYYLYRLGLSLDALDDPEALAVLEAAVAADPANRPAQDLLGARLANASRLDEAIALWQRQIEQAPEHAPALTNLGTAFEAQGDLDRARQHYWAATRANPDYAPAFDRYADLAMRQGAHRRAVDLLERLVHLRPDDPLVLDRLARSLAQANRPEQELATLNRLVDLRPAYWPARYAIAARLRTLDRRDEAIAAYYRVLEVNPDHVPTLIDLGVLLGSVRQITEATRLLERATRLAPDDPAAAYNYAVVQMERGAWDEARDLLGRVKQLAPDDPMPDRVLAEIDRRQGRGY